MTWNHRIIRRKEHGVEWIGIYEVFYNERGVPDACTTEPVGVSMEVEDGNMEEAKLQMLKELARMIASMDRPILDYDAIGGEDK